MRRDDWLNIVGLVVIVDVLMHWFWQLVAYASWWWSFGR